MNKFLYKIRTAFYRFMYGRYGTDTLSKVILWCYSGVLILYLILSVVFSFTMAGNALATTILNVCYFILSGTLAYLLISRMFSRNISKRRAENEKFCGFFKLRHNMYRDRKTHVYRKCPKCRAVLRLPRAKGKHTVVCPRCRNRFEVKG